MAAVLRLHGIAHISSAFLRAPTLHPIPGYIEARNHPKGRLLGRPTPRRAARHSGRSARRGRDESSVRSWLDPPSGAMIVRYGLSILGIGSGRCTKRICPTSLSFGLTHVHNGTAHVKRRKIAIYRVVNGMESGRRRASRCCWTQRQ